MGPANGGSSVGGIGFTVEDPEEPQVTIKASLDRYKVCIRRSRSWKEAVAEFVSKEHAEFLAEALRTGQLAIPEECNISRDANVVRRFAPRQYPGRRFRG